MSESEKPIKVVDRRLFTADGEVRDEVQAELAAPDPAPEPAAAPAGPAPAGPAPAGPVPATSPAFLRLLDMLAQTAALYMEGFPDPATGRRQVDLAGARQIVDSLIALREKTRGRLSFEEADAIEGLLGELQLAFTRLAAPAKPKSPIPPPVARRG
ncbi:MAG TPA: DUF1844 domain-containing protein [Thermoanaerobaculia bacterium]|nr:DUF1844 domain-containing protein [Thermoanaerobaculia bacterium]